MTLKKILPLTAALAVALPAGQAAAAPKPKFKFAAANVTVREGDASVTCPPADPSIAGFAGCAKVTVKRAAKGSNSAGDVRYTTQDGSAHAGTDYIATSGTLHFGSGVATQSFWVRTVPDTITDASPLKTVRLNLRPTKGSVAANPQATLTIVDDDGPAAVSFAAASTSAFESVGTANVMVVRSGDSSDAVSAHFSTTTTGTASGSDYTSVSDQLVSFPSSLTDPSAAAYVQYATVAITDDNVVEPNETVGLALANAADSHGPIAITPRSSATLTIFDDDAAQPVLAFDPATYDTTEADGGVYVYVTRSGNYKNTVTVDYETQDGTAKAGSDYTATLASDPNSENTLAFYPADATDPTSIPDTTDVFFVPILEDSAVEGPERFFANLLGSTLGGGAVLGSATQAAVNIADDDHSTGGGGSDTGGDTSGAGSGTIGGSGATGPNGTDGTGTGTGEQLVLGARQSACGLVVKAAKKQKLLKKKVLVLKVRSGQRCKVSFLATIKQLKPKSKRQAQIVRALRFKAKKVSLSLQPGKATTVKVKFTKKTLKAIKKALQARKKLVATVVVSERDAASAVKKRTLKITIRR